MNLDTKLTANSSNHFFNWNEREHTESINEWLRSILFLFKDIIFDPAMRRYLNVSRSSKPKTLVSNSDLDPKVFSISDTLPFHSSHVSSRPRLQTIDRGE
jgi:hypothetical protein